MISHKANMTRAIDFKGPLYLPSHIDINFKWLYDKDEVKTKIIRELLGSLKVDMIEQGYHQPDDPARYGCPDGTWYDEWGVRWKNDGHGGRVCVHPLEAGYDRLPLLIIPEAGNITWFADAMTQFKTNPDKFHIGMVWYTLFERLWMLRGFNNMLMDPYINTKDFAYLRDLVVDFSLAQIDVFGDLNADAIFFSDDWGSQRTLLMKPDDWRTFYKPAYMKLFRRVRDRGMKVIMHLCGNVSEILPDLLEMGLNVLNPVQPQAMDVMDLSKKFGGRLCFYGGVDVQKTMVYGSPGDVREEVQRLVDLFGSYNGGYICSTSHSIMPETPLENIIALLEAIHRFSDSF